jgi:hypothetical protein
MFLVVIRCTRLLQIVVTVLDPCNLYLEVLSVVTVVHVTDVQFAVNEISNVVDGSRWRL